MCSSIWNEAVALRKAMPCQNFRGCSARRGRSGPRMRQAIPHFPKNAFDRRGRRVRSDPPRSLRSPRSKRSYGSAGMPERRGPRTAETRTAPNNDTNCPNCSRRRAIRRAQAHQPILGLREPSSDAHEAIRVIRVVIRAIRQFSCPWLLAHRSPASSLRASSGPSAPIDHLIEGHSIQPPPPDRDPTNARRVRDVIQRISGDQHEVGAFPRLDRAPR